MEVPPVERTGPAELSFDGSEDARSWIGRNRADLLGAVTRHGALLVRGLGPTDAQDVSALCRALFGETVPPREPFAGRAPRAPGVHGALEWSRYEDLCPHHEQTYRTTFPRVLAIACLAPAPEGGATLLADGLAVLDALPTALVDRFEERGWMLRRSFGSGPTGLSWEEVHGHRDRDVVTRRLEEQGIDHTWRPNGRLRTRQRADATITHPLTGRRSWFNQAAFLNSQSMDAEIREILVATYGLDDLPLDTRFGDGEPIPPGWVELINDTYREHSRTLVLGSGDLLLIDNIRMAHGRTAYSGDRDAVVSMGFPVRSRSPR